MPCALEWLFLDLLSCHVNSKIISSILLLGKSLELLLRVGMTLNVPRVWLMTELDLESGVLLKREARVWPCLCKKPLVT